MKTYPSLLKVNICHLSANTFFSKSFLTYCSSSMWEYSSCVAHGMYVCARTVSGMGWVMTLQIEVICLFSTCLPRASSCKGISPVLLCPWPWPQEYHSSKRIAEYFERETVLLIYLFSGPLEIRRHFSSLILLS